MSRLYTHIKHALFMALNAILGRIGYSLIPNKITRAYRSYIEALITQLPRKHPDTSVLIFSRNRAMQLDALLSSMYRCVGGLGDVIVLYRADGDHKASYDELARKYMAIFIEEEEFYDDVFDIISEFTSDYVLLLVDDMMFTRRHTLSRELLTVNGLLKTPTDKPYPIGLGGFTYNRMELIAMISSVRFRNPNTMELALQWFRPLFDGRPVTYYTYPPCIAIECNTVQDEFATAVPNTYPSEELLTRWNEGWRINTTLSAKNKELILCKP